MARLRHTNVTSSGIPTARGHRPPLLSGGRRFHRPGAGNRSAVPRHRAHRALPEQPLHSAPLSRMEPVVGAVRVAQVRAVLGTAREHLGGREVWHVSDTRSRGGVAELLRDTLPYLSGEGITSRWATLEAAPEFREFTKALYYRLCGVAPPRRVLDLERGRTLYERVCRAEAARIAGAMDRRCVVVLHDHQTAGLIPHLRDAGHTVLWRAHIGPPLQPDLAEEGWAFLRRYLAGAHGYVASCEGVLPEDLPGPRHLVPPSINPLSPKNLALPAAIDPRVLLARAGLVEHGADGRSGALAELLLRHPVQILRGTGPVPRGAPMVTQVSRWDPVKDIPGVISAFADHVDPGHGAHLLLVGPGVGQDRQAGEVFAQCRARWEGLGRMRERVHLVQVPTEHPSEHALLVNAVQRCATAVLQKSLAEGFGLTVSEAAWKGRPVVASPVGGLLRQVEHDRTGLLLAHPRDGRGLGAAINRLLAEPSLAEELGGNGRQRVRRHFLTDSSLLNFSRVLSDTAAPSQQ